MGGEIVRDTLREQLHPFLENNPEAHYQATEDGCVIERPWGDGTVRLKVRPGAVQLIEDLNAVHLPPRFTAIWHYDNAELEIIWGPLRADSEFRSRHFEFQFAGRSLHCEFGDASTRLLSIADVADLVPPSRETNFRNLGVIKDFSKIAKWKSAQTGEAQIVITSFWVRNLVWAEFDFEDVARHLNFYMWYFDRRSPRIIIHEAVPETVSEDRVLRHPFGPFPAEIAARQLDIYLLGLWETILNSPDPFLRFLYSYQILEYAAYYYVQEGVLQKVKRVLVAPDTCSRPGHAARLILDAMAEERMSDEAKIVAIVKQLVDPGAIWKEIEPHMSYFSHDVVFDGGFILPALLKPGWELDDFLASWIPKFPDSLRKLRNALVHARESRMAGVIAPTRRNSELLRPWLGPMSVVTMQAILYRDV